MDRGNVKRRRKGHWEGVGEKNETSRFFLACVAGGISRRVMYFSGGGGA